MHLLMILKAVGFRTNIFLTTPTPWLTLILVLGKNVLTEFRVKQVKWNQLIQHKAKLILEKEFLFRSVC